MDNSTINLQLSRSEALVLEAFLTDFEDRQEFKNIDLVNQLILYRLHSLLEHAVDALFDPDYDQLLKQARAEISKDQSE